MWKATPRTEAHKRYEITEPVAREAIAAGEAARAVVSEDGLITVSAMSGVAIVFLGMSQVRDRQAELIQAKLVEIADKGQGRLAVSMAGVATLTSSGINAFVAVHARCAKLGGHLALFALNKDLTRMIKVAKLDRALVLVENAQEAVRSFTASQKKPGLLAAAFRWAKPDKDAA
jgi:anti-anti-sigma factor